MKKTIFILALGIITLNLTSCKKQEENKTIEAEQLVSDEKQGLEVDPNLQAANNPVHKPEDLETEAKKNPLTSLALSENHFDFGDVKKGEKVEHQFKVTNTGDNPLIISSVKPGCGCTVPDYSKDPILPGESGFVTLKFDSSNFEGAQNKTASIYANVEQLPITLSFKANVIK